MSSGQPALVAITPQNPHQPSPGAFIKNITTRSSFCGTPTSTGRSFLNNRKSWNGTGTLPLQLQSDCTSPLYDDTPALATFRSKILSPRSESVRSSKLIASEGSNTSSPSANEARRSFVGNGTGRRYAEIGNWATR